jgi:hypothetical protein
VLQRAAAGLSAWWTRAMYLTWTEDNLLRQVSYQGQREDKPARQSVRPVPHPPRRGKCWRGTGLVASALLLQLPRERPHGSTQESR